MAYIDHIFGFPVHVKNATLIDFDGEQALKINQNHFDTRALHWTTEKVIRMEIFSKQLKNHVAYTTDELFAYLEQVPPQVVKPVIVDAKQTQIRLKAL